MNSLLERLYSLYTPQRPFVLATRTSQLALQQAYITRALILEKAPHLPICIQGIQSAGDLNPARSVCQLVADKAIGEGVFTSALQEALVCGDVDACVHSLKDVPSTPHPCTELTSMYAREDLRDCLVYAPGYTRYNARLIASGSPRRRAQFAQLFPHWTFKDIRGNIPTRIQKVDGTAYHGVVVAYAALQRLNLMPERLEIFSLEECLNAPGQGALGFEVRKDDKGAHLVSELLYDNETHICCEVERRCMQGLSISCDTAFACSARIEHSQLHVQARIFDHTGRMHSAYVTYSTCQTIEAAHDIIHQLMPIRSYLKD